MKSRMQWMLLLFVAGTLAARQPNFVLIFTDDQGYGDLSCFGGTHVSTPVIDQLAAEGAKCTSFYVPAPLCTPSRAGLMTGCYPRRIDMATGSTFGVLLAGDRKGLNPKEITIAEVLKGAGYATGMFGKWHLGDQPEFLPTRQGFDEFFGIPYSHDIHPQHPNQKHFHFPSLPLLDQETVIELDPDASMLTRRITERAVGFIEKHKAEPFFLYIPHPIPHSPLYVSEPFMKTVPDDVKAELAKEGDTVNYAERKKLFRQAMDEIDWSVGQIIASLKENALDRETIVVILSDNGPAIGSAGPLQGRKGSTFDGGMREPTVIWGPGRVKPGQVIDEILTSMDLLPTFAGLAGAAMPTDRVIDGKNIWPVLAGDPGAKSPHEAFFYHGGNTLAAIRSGPWKLHLKAAGALYNLDQDIGEHRDVAKQHPEVVARLRRLAADFQAELAASSRPAGFVDNPVPLTMKK